MLVGEVKLARNVRLPLSAPLTSFKHRPSKHGLWFDLLSDLILYGNYSSRVLRESVALSLSRRALLVTSPEGAGAAVVAESVAHLSRSASMASAWM